MVNLFLYDFMFSFVFFLMSIPFMFLRLVLVYYVFKYYLGTTERQRVLIIGVLSEMILPVIGLLIIPIGMTDPYIAVMLSIPIPILLFAGFLVMKLIPRPQSSSDWTGTDEGKDWWEKEESPTGS
jgi:hypothetical protein